MNHAKLISDAHMQSSHAQLSDAEIVGCLAYLNEQDTAAPLVKFMIELFMDEAARRGLTADTADTAVETTTLDPRIGQFSNGQYYAYLDGYEKEPFVGTLEDVKEALGILGQYPPAGQSQKGAGKRYTVVVRFQHPAWFEVDGIEYAGIEAPSKSAAVAIARVRARHDGHTGPQKGRYWFTAIETD